mgnify:FL=1
MYADLKIPKARVAVLIGKKGVGKRFLEKKLKVKIRVDKEGEVQIEGEGIDAMVAQRIVRAIGRGFNPKITLLLQHDTYHMEIVQIKDFAHSAADVARIKARMIGTKGKAWKMLERLLEVDISVYGNTVSIIGEAEKIELAKQAVEKLLQGAPHGKVYLFIEKQKKIHLE